MRKPLLYAGLAVIVSGPTVLAFFAGGYFDKPRLIAGIVVWTVAATAAIAAPEPLPRSGPGRMALAGLLLLCAWTGVSIAWAPIGGRAQDDLQRLLLYLGFFFSALILLRQPRYRRWLEPALAVGAFAIACYALSARLLPDVVHQHRSVSADGRLEQPLSYWNALGLLAGMGLLLTMRIAGDPTRPRMMRAVAAGAGVALGLTVYLTYSRGALAAVAAGVLVLMALAPRGRAQLRGIVAIAGASALAALVATRYPGVKSLDIGEHGDASAGAKALVALAALSLGAAAVVWRPPRRELPLQGLGVSRPAAVLVATGALVVAAAIGVAVFEGKPEGTSPDLGANPARLGSVDTNRYKFWKVAVETWTHHPLIGIGSGGFIVEWLKRRDRVDTSGDAHSLYLETPAELGLVGLAFLVLFLTGVVMGVVRLHRRDAGAATGLAAVLAAFAVHAALDWDWEIPAVSLFALLAAAAALAWSEDRRAAQTTPHVAAQLDGRGRRTAIATSGAVGHGA
jgi:O-antigen ligase